MWLKLAVPVLLSLVGKLAPWLVNRLKGHIQTTTQSSALFAGLLGLFQVLGCDMGLAQQMLIAGVGAAPLALSTDPKATAQTLLEVMKDAALNAKRPALPADTQSTT